MLYKPLSIIHLAKGLLKRYNVVQKLSNSLTKVGVTHGYQAFIKMLGFKLLSESLLYIGIQIGLFLGFLNYLATY